MRSRTVFQFVILTAFAGVKLFADGPATKPVASLPPIHVSENGRFLTTVDATTHEAKPFFYLGDTAWCIFNHASSDDVDEYLDDRAAKGFTVIQGCVAVWDFRTRRNPDGETPFTGNDPTAINEAYFKNVDDVVDKCTRRGLHVAMLPFWTKNTRSGPFSEPAGMRTYCQYLGKRYAAKNVIFVLGGDTSGTEIQPVVDAEAEGLQQGAKEAGIEKITITYHPTGRESSSFWFHERPWLVFNSIQSGHFINTTNFQIVSRDFLKRPVKPTLDMEPGYENITNNLVRGPAAATAQRIQAVDVRRSAYLAVFSGAAGHTYGNGEVYEFYHPANNAAAPGRASWHANMDWKEALKLPASGQVQFVRWLLESRPYFSRIPDQSLIAGANSDRAINRIVATRAEDGSYAMLYLPAGQKNVAVNTGKLSGDTLNFWWYDPRTGAATQLDTVAKNDSRTLTTPSAEPLPEGTDDWVLVIDDAAKKFPPPGSRALK
ncbi:MAG TPA: glycoside hydrolase family 140 protein [Pirellulales bacterium]|jgi:hypothetical protein